MSIKKNILHRDGAPKVYESPAMQGQFLCFTSNGDDMVNKIIGKGQKLSIENSEGVSEKSIIVRYLEDIQLKDAYIFWEGAVWGDSITIEAQLPANTPLYKQDRTGNAEMIDGVVTYITASQSPDETWTGSYLLFPIDVSLVRFVDELPLNGTNNIGTVIESKSAALINKELQLKMILRSTTNNLNVKITAVAEIYRLVTL